MIFHLQIKEGKVWVHEDLTDIDIARVLKEKGIPESDIILGYTEPYQKGFSNFAST